MKNCDTKKRSDLPLPIAKIFEHWDWCRKHQKVCPLGPTLVKYACEMNETCAALKKAYDTLYLISCSRYGEGLTCTDSIHEVVTMAKKCEEELYANEAIRKIVEPSEEGGGK